MTSGSLISSGLYQGSGAQGKGRIGKVNFLVKNTTLKQELP